MPGEGSGPDLPHEVVEIEQWKAEHFVRQLAAKPFACFVISGDQILVFETGLSQPELRRIQVAITELIQED